MNLDEYKNQCLKKSLDYRPPQFNFYTRTLNFLKSDKKFLINPAGMGFGKTPLTTWLINDFKDEYDIILIANPTDPLKYVWLKSLKENKLIDVTAPWPSKKSLCIYKRIFKDRKIPIDSICNDDCPYMKDHKCGNDKQYTDLCEIDYNNYLLMNDKLTPNNYYKLMIEKYNILQEEIKEISLGKDNVDYLKDKKLPFGCLCSPTRMGLRDGKRMIIVGDYYGFLKQKMFRMVTKKDPYHLDSLLIIDEGHLINPRAKSEYSNKIYLNKNSLGLKNELNKYIQYTSRHDESNIIVVLDMLNEINNKIIVKGNKKTNFDYKTIKKLIFDDDLGYDTLIKSLGRFMDIVDKNKEPEEKSSDTEKVYNYLKAIKENDNDDSFYNFAENITLYNKEDIILSSICLNPSNKLKEVWKSWDKVIINTGTLYKNKKIALDEIGICDNQCTTEEMINSYDLSKNVFTIAENNFNSKYREGTYKNNINKLCEVLSNLNGKTIIFIQAKDNSLLLEDLLKKNRRKVINFCKKENKDGEVSAEDFEILKEKFVSGDKDLIGIINIMGRVEGHNFTDGDDIPQVNNVIIYGFPMPSADDISKARHKFYIKKYGNKEDCLFHIFLNEPIHKIQQASYRCKRSPEQTPTIILWGKRFAKEDKIYVYPEEDGSWENGIIGIKNNIFNSLPKEFQKNYINYSELIEELKKRNQHNG